MTEEGKWSRDFRFQKGRPTRKILVTVIGHHHKLTECPSCLHYNIEGPHAACLVREGSIHGYYLVRLGECEWVACVELIVLPSVASRASHYLILSPQYFYFAASRRRPSTTHTHLTNLLHPTTLLCTRHTRPLR